MTAGHKLHGASGAIVLLHGRGGSAEDILRLRHDLAFPDVAYVAPQAPGYAWYPQSFLAPVERNEPWLSQSLETVAQAVREAVDGGIPREKIVLAGFSQGACLATEFVARHAARYGGLLAFTGGLIGPPGTVFHYAGSLAGTPAFLAAGDPDAHVPWQRVEESARVLAAMGAEVTLRRYPGLPHTIGRDEIAAARELLAKSLASSVA